MHPAGFSLAIVLIAAPCFAQTMTLEEADTLFQAGQWAEAEEAYLELSRYDTTNGEALYRLGYARYMQGEFDEAAQNWRHAGRIGYQPARSFYNAASAFARSQRKDEAFEALNQAVEAGFRQAEVLDTDTDLDLLRNDDRFELVRTALDRKARPCHYAERNRAFDFWIGDWDVLGADGRKLGTNTVELMLGECVLQENWTGSQGGAGKSFNYFDPKAAKWKQLWVNASGGFTEFEGSFSDGAMRFEGTVVAPDGSTTLSRMTFTPLEDGRVRQYIEQSDDDGTTWTPAFDGYYVRRDDASDH